MKLSVLIAVPLEFSLELPLSHDDEDDGADYEDATDDQHDDKPAGHTLGRDHRSATVRLGAPEEAYLLSIEVPLH